MSEIEKKTDAAAETAAEAVTEDPAGKGKRTKKKR